MPATPSETLRARVLAAALIGIFYIAIATSAATLPTLGAGGVLVDFDAFYIVSQMLAEGRVAEAYDVRLMAARQQELVGHEGFMPWTYPPPFDLLVAPLAWLPRGLAFALFTGTTLAFYLWVLARLAGHGLGTVMLVLAPPIYVSVTIGQNSFLTGGLMGLFCLLSLRGKVWAGVPLGLLIIKPHLGLGLGMQALASARWPVVALAAAVAALACGLATLAFGPAIWRAFLTGVETAGDALALGIYPLFRMISVYALAFTAGLSPNLASILQGAMALAAMAVVLLAVRRGLPAHQTLALACFASAMVSPYLYDYDMALAGVGAALILGDIMARTSPAERLALLALAWVAGGWGILHALSNAGLPWAERAAIARETLAYAGVAYLILMALLWRILRRPV
mgnify:CR=1 FL=1